MIRIRQLIFLCALFIAAFGCVDRAAQSQSATRSVRVEIADASNHRSLKGARVFILSEDGKQVDATVTNDQGIATLTVDESQRPQYILAEHPAYFLSGLRWREGQTNYYVLMTILTVP